MQIVDAAELADLVSSADAAHGTLLVLVPGLRSDVLVQVREAWAPVHAVLEAAGGVSLGYVRNIGALVSRSLSARHVLECHADQSASVVVRASTAVLVQLAPSCSLSAAAAVVAELARRNPSSRFVVTATLDSLQSAQGISMQFGASSSFADVTRVHVRGDVLVNNGTANVTQKYVYWSPATLGGLLCMAFIVLFYIIAVCCIMSIQTQMEYEKPEDMALLGAAGSD